MVKNKKGFTLGELLATIVILGLIMVVAVPNVMGILDKNRSSTYVTDAKKLATLAEYQVRSGGNTVQKPSTNNCIVLTLSYLDNSEFEDPPNGGDYLKQVSFVVVKKEGNELKYYVQLVENFKSTFRGVPLVEASKLSEDGATNNLVDNFKKADINVGSIPDKIRFVDFARKFNSRFSCNSVTAIYDR